MASVEVLITGDESKIGTAILHAAVRGATAAGLDVSISKTYRGGADWLCLFGVGDKQRGAARERQLAAGRHVAMWDLGYFGASKDPVIAYARVSVDDFHPQRWLSRTPNDARRWMAQGIELRREFNPTGRVVVVGMGPKSREQLGLYGWELQRLKAAQARFPDRQIIYRPKRDLLRLPWELQDCRERIEDVLAGASLVICHHSNVGIDACIAGVPVETEDGAAAWLYSRQRNPDEAARLDFLRRVAWWNWNLGEMAEAWTFMRGIVED